MNAAPYLTQQGMATQQLQTVIVQNPAEEYPSFAVRKASSTGGIQLVLGILSIIFQISATAIEAEYGSTAAGIWAGFSVSLICITMVDTRTHSPRMRREPIFVQFVLENEKTKLGSRGPSPAPPKSTNAHIFINFSFWWLAVLVLL